MTQALKIYPHGIFAAGGALVPTQEKKKALKISENYKILRKSLNWVDTERYILPPF